MLGEEITYDYGKEYFDEYIKPKGCRCEKHLALAKTQKAEPAKRSAKVTSPKSKSKKSSSPSGKNQKKTAAPKKKK